MDICCCSQRYSSYKRPATCGSPNYMAVNVCCKDRQTLTATGKDHGNKLYAASANLMYISTRGILRRRQTPNAARNTVPSQNAGSPCSGRVGTVTGEASKRPPMDMGTRLRGHPPPFGCLLPVDQELALTDLNSEHGLVVDPLHEHSRDR